MNEKGSNKEKGLEITSPTPFIFLVGQGGVEPPTLGFSVDNLIRAISHHI
jgi:hypothetical protein